jgi:hypothetical protein
MLLTREDGLRNMERKNAPRGGSWLFVGDDDDGTVGGKRLWVGPWKEYLRCLLPSMYLRPPSLF